MGTQGKADAAEKDCQQLRSRVDVISLELSTAIDSHHHKLKEITDVHEVEIRLLNDTNIENNKIAIEVVYTELRQVKETYAEECDKHEIAFTRLSAEYDELRRMNKLEGQRVERGHAQVSLGLRFKCLYLYFFILLVSCFMWSGALDSSHLLLSYPTMPNSIVYEHHTDITLF